MDVMSQSSMELSGPIELHLFGGCCLEAQRCDTVALQLEALRNALMSGPSPVHLTPIIDGVRASGRFLRELADLSQVHQDRLPVVLNHLNIILPCLSRTLRDITGHYEDRSLTKKNRWRTMYHKMMEEADGTPLSQRFSIYNYFLTSLRDVLIRSPNFDFNGLETAREKIMQLRENRGIPPPPSQVGPRMQTSSFSFETDPSGSPFNDDKICLLAYENGHDGCPYLLLRVINPETGQAWFSQRGCHELCIDRDGCVLRLKRWSHTSNRSKNWAVLNFLTWEELILMYCSFLALKARNDLTVDMGHGEYSLAGERKLFQA
ncbi:hypothetical protein ACO1O0_001220 [Amphichorda felina]